MNNVINRPSQRRLSGGGLTLIGRPVRFGLRVMEATPYNARVRCLIVSLDLAEVEPVDVERVVGFFEGQLSVIAVFEPLPISFRICPTKAVKVGWR